MMREDWVVVELGEVGKVVSGGTPKTSVPEYWGNEISWITPADLSGYNEKFISKGKKSITREGLKNSSAKLMPAHSVLYSSRAPIGYVAIAKNELATNQGFKSLVPFQVLFPEYLYYHLKSIKSIADKKASGTTFKELSAKGFSTLPLKIAPLPEQRAIVAKIEQLFSELDNAIANLKAAKDKLEIYRQAVLKKAFEGELTKEWRRGNSRNFTRQSETINNSNCSSNNYPEHWGFVKLDQLSEAIAGYAFKSRQFKKEVGKYQVIRIGNIRPGTIRVDEAPVFIDIVDNNVLSKSKLLPKDVLITLTGTRKKRDYGYTAIVNKSNLLLNQRVAALRFNENCMPEFFLYFSWTNDFKEQFFGSETGNVGQGNVGMKAIRLTKIPLPPIQEQNQIVQEIETRLSICDNIQASIDEDLEKTEALRQSILKKAFEGRLLSEEELEACRREPDWEPADKLLERIKTSKEEGA